MNKFLETIRPFRMPLILVGVLLVVFLVATQVMPLITNLTAEDSPITGIEASTDKVYLSGEEIQVSDFSAQAIHEDGSKTRLASDEINVQTDTIYPVGATSMVTIALAEDRNITCEVEVSVEREPILGFECGYPELDSVTAVLYSNGELCFEGEGDVLVFAEGEYPWLDYEEMDESPILAVSFEEGVEPTNMNYWFEGCETLTYIDRIPSSVTTMVRTFKDCISLIASGDWSACENLLNISEAYSGCTVLGTASPIPSSVRTANNTYENCVNLQSDADVSEATSLLSAQYMYSGCSKLIEAELAPNIVDMTGMFENCINLQAMPNVPDSVDVMDGTFSGCSTLETLTVIPVGVSTMERCFENCEVISGDLTINADCEDFQNMFAGAALATKVNLIGTSKLLDAYANTYDGFQENDRYGVFVNGEWPDASITSYEDVFSDKSITHD